MDSIHRILVVDDDTAFCHNIARLLQNRGYPVQTAFNGAAALKQLKQSGGEIKVVLLDIRMPEMDGLETLQRIKSLFPEVQVIILTGCADVDYGVQAIRDGAFDFLVKPCDIDDLTEKVRSACDLEQIRRRPVLWQRTMAGELILSLFVDLYPDDSLQRALEILNSDRSRMAAEMLFVVDRQKRLQGFITREAMIKAAQAAHPHTGMTWDFLSRHPEYLPSATVSQIMVHDIFFTRKETPLAELAVTMMQKRFRSMPVVEQDKIIGIVRLRDILRYLDMDAYESFK